MARILSGSIAAAALAVSCSGNPMDALSGFVGSWEGTHRIAGDDTTYAAAYEVSRDQGALIWTFRSEWGGGFTGRGVQLWDDAAGGYLETWTDSSGAEPSTQRGAWDAGAGVLLMRGKGSDWETGEPISYRHRTVLHEPDRWSYVMIAERKAGAEEVMWIEMRRK